ncbi:MAG: cell envelope integrity protein TolA [Syntrophorhabdales bacterium]|jgi:TonB family protein
MREENWYKMLAISAVLHVIIIGAFSIPLKGTVRKQDLSYYSVNLIGDIAGDVGAPKASPAAGVKPSPPPQKKRVEPKKVLERERTVSRPRERSLSPRKKNVPQATTKEEVRSLDQRIREMKSRTRYMDVSGRQEDATGAGSGLPATSGGGSGPFDPVLQKYYADVWERIQESWHSPNVSAGKNLLTVVSIRIRKDGRITDWTIERRSGNRAYDESIARALRSINLLPPIPSPLNTDSIEVGFNFHPPGETR